MQIEPADLAELMRPQRNDLSFIDTAAELATYRIALQGAEMPSRLTQTMAVSLCANGWLWSRNYAFDRDGYFGLNPFQTHLEIAKEIDWNAADSTFLMDFGEVRKSIITVVPLLGGSEGTITFCAIEQSNDGGRRSISCLGYIRLETVSETIGWIREGNELEYPCLIKRAAEPMSIAGQFPDNFAYALVPGSTPIELIGSTLDVLGRIEAPIEGP